MSIKPLQTDERRYRCGHLNIRKFLGAHQRSWISGNPAGKSATVTVDAALARRRTINEPRTPRAVLARMANFRQGTGRGGKYVGCVLY